MEISLTGKFLLQIIQNPEECLRDKKVGELYEYRFYWSLDFFGRG
jgi:hypothetical protein